MEVPAVLFHHSRGPAQVASLCELGKSGPGDGDPSTDSHMATHHTGGGPGTTGLPLC